MCCAAYSIQAISGALAGNHKFVLTRRKNQNWSDRHAQIQHASSLLWFLCGVEELQTRAVHYSADQLLIVVVHFNQQVLTGKVLTSNR